jgi:hypothetical protein
MVLAFNRVWVSTFPKHSGFEGVGEKDRIRLPIMAFLYIEANMHNYKCPVGQ